MCERTHSCLLPFLVLGLVLSLCPVVTTAAEEVGDDGAEEVGDDIAGDVVYDGAELYALNCSNCHGTYGEGDGAVTPDLSVVLLDLRYLAARNDGVFPEAFVERIVDGREVRAAHGPTGMPIWGAEFTRGEGVGEDAQARVGQKIDAIVDFLESIQILE